jgi:hypothetical protein
MASFTSWLTLQWTYCGLNSTAFLFHMNCYSVPICVDWNFLLEVLIDITMGYRAYIFILFFFFNTSWIFCTPSVTNALLSYNIVIPALGWEGGVNKKFCRRDNEFDSTVGNPYCHCLVIRCTSVRHMYLLLLYSATHSVLRLLCFQAYYSRGLHSVFQVATTALYTQLA